MGVGMAVSANTILHFVVGKMKIFEDGIRQNTSGTEPRLKDTGTYRIHQRAFII